MGETFHEHDQKYLKRFKVQLIQQPCRSSKKPLSNDSLWNCFNFVKGVNCLYFKQFLDRD